MQEYNCSKQWLSEKIFWIFLWPVQHVCHNFNCGRYFMKYSGIYDNLIGDPDRDVTYHCSREYFHLEMLLINHDAGHVLKFV